jgi:hypothetical protein
MREKFPHSFVLPYKHSFLLSGIFFSVKFIRGYQQGITADNLINQGPMKRVLLLAAVHVLILNQVYKDAKEKVQLGASKKEAMKQESLRKVSHQVLEPEDKDFVTAVYTGEWSDRNNRRPLLRQ